MTQPGAAATGPTPATHTSGTYASEQGRAGKGGVKEAAMKRSTDRILTTHVGSLARPPELMEILKDKHTGKPYDEAAYRTLLRTTVADVVKKQAEVGVDIASDGEFGKSGF